MTTKQGCSFEQFTGYLAALTSDPKAFSRNAAMECIDFVSSPECTESDIKRFLVLLTESKLDETPGIIAACATALRQKALRPEISAHCRENRVVADIVGTGGDGQDTFNVSTAAAIVAASCGLLVAKHGNRSTSSTRSGSADFIEALGSRLEAASPEAVSSLLEETNFCFLFAALYHPSMKRVAKVRRELKTKSIFNLLGPLTNPAQPSHVVVGVYDASVGPIMAEALLALPNIKAALVVHGCVKLDEFSPVGDSLVWQAIKGKGVRHYTVNPVDDFGLPETPLDQVKGLPSPKDTADLFKRLLANPKDERYISVLNYILMNAAALLYVAEKAADFKEGVSIARDAVYSGSALRCLTRYLLLAG